MKLSNTSDFDFKKDLIYLRSRRTDDRPLH